mmetsp:Transcript_12589/g.21409  ORF Transcript_12589/g.21409 Transcript_12589/m.21409 type:complete len:99 (+) Transcript_12589:641-937(+)
MTFLKKKKKVMMLWSYCCNCHCHRRHSDRNDPRRVNFCVHHYRGWCCRIVASSFDSLIIRLILVAIKSLIYRSRRLLYDHITAVGQVVHLFLLIVEPT